MARNKPIKYRDDLGYIPARSQQHYSDAEIIYIIRRIIEEYNTGERPEPGEVKGIVGAEVLRTPNAIQEAMTSRGTFIIKGQTPLSKISLMEALSMIDLWETFTSGGPWTREQFMSEYLSAKGQVRPIYLTPTPEKSEHLIESPADQVIGEHKSEFAPDQDQIQEPSEDPENTKEEEAASEQGHTTQDASDPIRDQSIRVRHVWSDQKRLETLMWVMVVGVYGLIAILLTSMIIDYL